MAMYDSVNNMDDNLLERFEELKDREAAGTMDNHDRKELYALRRRFGLQQR